MDTDMKPQVGGVVYVIPYGQKTAKGKRHVETVTNIGRTYFYTNRGTAFALASEGGRWLDKDTGIGYGHNWEAFPSEAALQNHYRRHALIGEARRVDWGDLSLSQLEGVMAIVRSESAP